ncbi:hypothetical protein BD289DRAFT_175661 [Coniella lustricola]|uniref:Uncharacterized protein n=1 Tax=Coniella lustricola TaxID=2025994 RepID=A0A2T3ADV7_9PEZI|nr:hypothetical protein BD289DRAFT_175661 [Coniella lustricola]
MSSPQARLLRFLMRDWPDETGPMCMVQRHRRSRTDQWPSSGRKDADEGHEPVQPVQKSKFKISKRWSQDGAKLGVPPQAHQAKRDVHGCACPPTRDASARGQIRLKKTKSLTIGRWDGRALSVRNAQMPQRADGAQSVAVVGPGLVAGWVPSRASNHRPVSLAEYAHKHRLSRLWSRMLLC